MNWCVDFSFPTITLTVAKTKTQPALDDFLLSFQ